MLTVAEVLSVARLWLPWVRFAVRWRTCEGTAYGLGGRLEMVPVLFGKNGRDDWIRTSDPLTPSQVRYQAAPHPEIFLIKRDFGLAEARRAKADR